MFWKVDSVKIVLGKCTLESSFWKVGSVKYYKSVGKWILEIVFRKVFSGKWIL